LRTLGNRRRGTGAIIGAAFLLLIIISGYSLYLFQTTTQATSQAMFSQMNSRDRDASQEALLFNNLKKYSSNKIQLNVTNTGPLPLHFTYIGIFDNSVNPQTQTYTSVDIYVNAGSTYITPDSTSTPSTSSPKFFVQLVTDRGNLYQTIFPYTATGSSGGITLVEVTQFIQNYYASAAGDISINYRTIERAYRSPRTQVTGLSFVSNWQVDSSEYLCWRMQITNNGVTTISIDSNTNIRFEKSNGGTVSFFIVHNQGTDAVPSLVTYSDTNVDTIAPGESLTLYFASKIAGGNPSTTSTSTTMGTVDKYAGSLLFYDSTLQYGQTIPYIAINAV
jgi:hypothetical protein